MIKGKRKYYYLKYKNRYKLLMEVITIIDLKVNKSKTKQNIVL